MDPPLHDASHEYVQALEAVLFAMVMGYGSAEPVHFYEKVLAVLKVGCRFAS